MGKFLSRRSLYWDDFERRINETVIYLAENKKPPIRRVSVFITERCNFKCKYCNGVNLKDGKTLSEQKFRKIVKDYGDSAIIHITGGEPSVVPWLYPFLEENGSKYRFHLNTNAFVLPPAKHVKRLKLSLDHFDAVKWNEIVGVKAFDRVVKNIKIASQQTITSLTYTLTKENYKNVVEFARFSNKEFPHLYAQFFSTYKGNNPVYAFTNEDAEDLFLNVLPTLKKELTTESLALLEETLDEKRRLFQGVRFIENSGNVCYLSMTEKVFSPEGKEYTCSHLYRDGVFLSEPGMHEKCKYGCNRRLVKFNEEVQQKLKEKR